MNIAKLAAKIKVVVTALPTRLAVAAVVLSGVAQYIGLVVHGPDAALIAAWALRGVAAIGVAISIIRKVTPVLDEAVGILPQPVPAPAPVIVPPVVTVVAPAPAPVEPPVAVVEPVPATSILSAALTAELAQYHPGTPGVNVE